MRRAAVSTSDCGIGLPVITGAGVQADASLGENVTADTIMNAAQYHRIGKLTTSFYADRAKMIL